MWREHAHRFVQQLEDVLETVPDLDAELAVVPRVRRLIYLRRLEQELFLRIVRRRPSLIGWTMQQRDEIRAVLDAEMTEGEEG